MAVLDAACGTGGLMKRLIDQGFPDVKGFDVSPYAVSIARKKTGTAIHQLNLKEVDQIYSPNTFDAIVCNDALYFIEESELPPVLQKLQGLLKEDGILIINLLAFRFFRGMHDVSVAINERWTYTKFERMANRSFKEKVNIQYTYWPFLLSPLILATRFWQQLYMKIRPNSKVVSDVQLPPLVLNRIFYNLTKWEVYLPFSRWIGSSLYIVIHR